MLLSRTSPRRADAEARADLNPSHSIPQVIAGDVVMAERVVDQITALALVGGATQRLEEREVLARVLLGLLRDHLDEVDVARLERLVVQRVRVAEERRLRERRTPLFDV